MSKGKIVLFVIVILVIAIQFIPSGRPEVITINNNDLLSNAIVPDSVSQILKATCYDCHSNETYYPWYAYVAPVSWLVSRDTRIGRANLNFSDWEAQSKMDKAEYLTEIAEEIEIGNMPMPIYVLMHPEAKLSKQDRELLIRWTDDFGESLFE